MTARGLAAALALAAAFGGISTGAQVERASARATIADVAFVLRLALTMADDYGCVGVVVDAKPGVEAFYAKYGFVAIEALEGRSDARPAPAPMFLSIREIRGAVGKT